MSKLEKVVFATIFDPNDIQRGSGTYFYMSHEIERQGYEVQYIGPIDIVNPKISHALQSFHYRTGKRYKTFLDPFIARSRGKSVTQLLEDHDYQVLITNDFGIAGYSHTKKPIILYTDAMIPFSYPEGVARDSRIANLSSLGVGLFKHTIKRGLKNSTLCVFPEHGLAEEAAKYLPHINKIKVIPFGANIEDPGNNVAKCRRFSKIQERGVINFLFVGKDWQRKGGDIAINTVNELHKRGIKSKLQIIGATYPKAIDQDCVKSYGLLNKSSQEDLDLLHKIYIESDIFILPSKSEGFVIAVLEAAAYGLPTLAYDIPGVNKGVINGRTGILLHPRNTEQDFAEVVCGWFDHPEEYNQMVTQARNHFNNTTNWKESISKLFQEISRYT